MKNGPSVGGPFFAVSWLYWRYGVLWSWTRHPWCVEETKLQC